MNEPYSRYSSSVKNEINSRLDKENEEHKPKQKGMTLWQKLKLSFFLLINKAPK